MSGSRGFGSYELSQRRRPRQRAWLRTARLNAVGWTALIGACVVVAGIGIAAASVLAVPRWYGLVLGVLPLGAVAVLDRRRWSRMETSFGWGGSEEEVARIVSELAGQGVTAEAHTAVDAVAWGEPADGRRSPDALQRSEAGLRTASLSYRNRDGKTVAATLRAHGISLPEFR